MASNRAWASGATGNIVYMAMSRGRMPLRLCASLRQSAMGAAVSKWATIMAAFTPVSVRPAPVTGVGVRSTMASACSMVCCTEQSCGCTCQPW